jgi:predicted dehydrogenase
MSLRAAVVGVGYLGRFHAQKYRDLCANKFQGQVQLIGVCDLNAENAAKVATECGTQSFTNPSDLIGKVDLVTIATITPKHYELAKFFLSQGIHVNVEKPMTVTVVDAQELVALAKEKNLILTVGHSERFSPVYSELKKCIFSPKTIELHRHAPYKSRGADVSVVLDLMIHDIDLALALDPSKAKVVSAAGGKLASPTLDWARCEIQFESGLTALISVSRMASLMTRAFRVVDQKENFEGNFQTGDFSRVNFSGGLENVQVQTQNCGKSDNLFSETENFIQSVVSLKAGQPSNPLVPGVDGLRAMEIAQSVLDRINNL